MSIIFSHLKFLLCMFLVRVLCLLIVKSHFVPDEYWQSLEVAHLTVFGYGYATWEWKEAIRSFFYPFWFSFVYKILQVFGLDSVTLLILLPRLIQSFFSAVADVYFWLWMKNMILCKPHATREQLYWTYFMWVMCLFINYCSTRTLTNTAELNFSTLALFYYPWSGKTTSKTCHFLWFVGFACLVRPTAAIQWLPLCVFDLILNENPIRYYFTSYIKIMCGILCFSVGIDYLYYKKIVFTPFNFILYNGQYNIGIHYGTHSLLWYFMIGIPFVLGPAVVLFYFVIYKIVKNLVLQCVKKFIEADTTCSHVFSSVDYILFITFVWTISCYSMVPHKEFRFILPLVPIMLYLTGTNINFNFSKRNLSRNEIFLLFTSVAMIIFNLVGLIYLGLWHQVGPLKVISELANIASRNPRDSNFLFLTPCHSTPLYSHLHVNVTTRFLTCEPNLRNEQYYKDESDLFFEQPQNWLDDNFYGRNVCSMPSHIIFFSDLKPMIDIILSRYNYTQHRSVFNTHFTQGHQSQYFEIFQATKRESCFV